MVVAHLAQFLGFVGLRLETVLRTLVKRIWLHADLLTRLQRLGSQVSHIGGLEDVARGLGELLIELEGVLRGGTHGDALGDAVVLGDGWGGVGLPADALCFHIKIYYK